jgi:tRNA threonylcarbamoyladenosine biosynthesis protein TsaB
VELTLDTASPLAGIALTEQGRLLAAHTWYTRHGHAAELLPALDTLFERSGAARTDVTAIFVDRGPGGYAGLRVGISTALALAFALGADVLGYGRLEADAYPYLPLGRPVCAIHDAGRGEFAWAVYAGEQAEVLAAPRIGPPEALADTLSGAPIVAGEVAPALASLLAERLPDATVITGPRAVRHPATGAALAWARYAAGARDSGLALTPLYLREPNITTRRERPSAPR